MKSSKVGMLCVCLALTALASTGCGENLASATIKIASGQICALTATEILALNQAAIDVGAGQQPPVTVQALTQAQAMAIAEFAALNSLCTVQDIENLPIRIQTGPPLQGLDALAAAFGSIDPNNVDPQAIATLFQGILGGGGG